MCPVLVFAHASTHFAWVLNYLLRPFVLFKNKSVDFWFPSVRLPWQEMEPMLAVGGGSGTWGPASGLLSGLIKKRRHQEVSGSFLSWEQGPPPMLPVERKAF